MMGGMADSSASPSCAVGAEKLPPDVLETTAARDHALPLDDTL
jgi:hypothetical protein